MSRTLTILCAGAYGIRNAGDDLPLICLKSGMADLLPGVSLEFRALSRHPDPWEEAHYGVTMIKNLEHDSGEQARGRKFMGFNEGDDPAHLERIKREIDRCDMLVLGAGNALLDQTIGDMRGPIPLMALYGSLAGRARKPVMLYGMGIGPLHTNLGRNLTEGLLRTSAVISVRNLDSARLCRELLGTGSDNPQDRPPYIHVLPDATMTATNPGPARAREIIAAEGFALPGDRPVLALGLRDIGRSAGAAAQRRLEDAIQSLMIAMKDEVSFLFISQSLYAEDDDRVLARRMTAAAPPEARCHVIEGRYHPRDLIALYGLAAATLAVRLHAAVFSAIAHVPVAAVAYHPKVTGFLDQLETGAESLGTWDVTPESLIAMVRGRIACSDDERRSLAQRAAELGRRAAMYPLIAVVRGLQIQIGTDPMTREEEA